MATAHEPLQTIADRGEFSVDLAHALSTLVIELPPLIARRNDIPLLAQMLVEDFNTRGGKQLRGCTSEALDRLAMHDWPGQIDELAGVIDEACTHAEGFEVTLRDLPKRLIQAADAARFTRKQLEPIELEKVLADVELKLIERTCATQRGTKAKQRTC